MPDVDPTALIHHPYRAPDGFAAPQLGVYKASTVIFEDTRALRARDWRHKAGYTYGLHGTPTTFALEERIATLEGGTETLLVPSGLAAVALVDLALLRSGDEVLLPDNVYGPSRELARTDLARWGITHRHYDPMDAAGLAAMITERTRLVWLEAAGSVTMEFPDLPGLVKAARSRGVTTALDNTWGAGIAFRPFDLGIDVVMQALTKFPSGGGDVLMGSVTTRNAELHETIKLAHMHLGYGVAGNDAELVLRSLPSVVLRYHAHDATARYSAAQVDAFVDALRLFKIGYSWAGPVSLAVPYDLTAMRGTPPYPGTLVRFSIGLESAAALRADLEQALRVLT